MNYTRILPRDFFNESKLLKCFGQLSLKILDGMLPEGVNVTIDDHGEPFQIELADDGYLFIANYETFVNGRITTFKTIYNSKTPYPFYCVHPDTVEDVEVFNDAGEFTEEFQALASVRVCED